MYGSHIRFQEQPVFVTFLSLFQCIPNSMFWRTLMNKVPCKLNCLVQYCELSPPTLLNKIRCECSWYHGISYKRQTRLTLLLSISRDIMVRSSLFPKSINLIKDTFPSKANWLSEQQKKKVGSVGYTPWSEDDKPISVGNPRLKQVKGTTDTQDHLDMTSIYKEKKEIKAGAHAKAVTVHAMRFYNASFHTPYSQNWSSPYYEVLQCFFSYTVPYCQNWSNPWHSKTILNIPRILDASSLSMLTKVSMETHFEDYQQFNQEIIFLG